MKTSLPHLLLTLCVLTGCDDKKTPSPTASEPAAKTDAIPIAPPIESSPSEIVTTPFADPWRAPILFRDIQEYMGASETAVHTWLKQPDSEAYTQNVIRYISNTAALMEKLAIAHTRPRPQLECREIAGHLLTAMQRVLQISQAPIREDILPEQLKGAFAESLRGDDYAKVVISGVAYWRAKSIAESRKEQLLSQFAEAFCRAGTAWNSLGGSCATAPTERHLMEFRDKLPSLYFLGGTTRRASAVVKKGTDDPSILVNLGKEIVEVPDGTKIEVSEYITREITTPDRLYRVKLPDGREGQIRTRNVDLKSLTEWQPPWDEIVKKSKSN